MRDGGCSADPQAAAAVEDPEKKSYDADSTSRQGGRTDTSICCFDAL